MYFSGYNDEDKKECVKNLKQYSELLYFVVVYVYVFVCHNAVHHWLFTTTALSAMSGRPNTRCSSSSMPTSEVDELLMWNPQF